MRKLAGKAHPIIYEVVSLFKSEQATTEVTLMQVAAGGLPMRKSKSIETTKGDLRPSRRSTRRVIIPSVNL